MISRSRLVELSTHFWIIPRSYSAQSARMAKLDIHTKYKMLSGYEIPVLGYGVSVGMCPRFEL